MTAAEPTSSEIDRLKPKAGGPYASGDKVAATFAMQQTTAPSGPCFTAGPSGYFSYELDYSPQQKVTLLGLINGFVAKSTVYDARGQRWQSKGIDGPYRRSWWTVLLANTVYNPSLMVTVVWRAPAAYDVEELKGAYASAVKRDDDILTQFVSRQELQRRIAAAQSFAELVEVYQWASTDQEPSDDDADG